MARGQKIAGVYRKSWGLIKGYKWTLAAVAIFGVAVYGYAVLSQNEDAAAQSFSVIQKVDRGTVSSGIEATGEIKAAQKLDLDVYKQQARLQAVNIQNGSHVDAGEVLVSFDKSDANINARSSAVSVTEAKLGLQKAEKSAVDPSTEIRSLENQIAGYQESLKDAYLDFLNTDLAIEPGNSATENKVRPQLGGRYVKEGGAYRILIDFPKSTDAYRIESGFMYKVFDATGLIAEQELMYGIALPIADTGLTITFANNSGLSEGDKWILNLPNTGISTYADTKAKYEAKVRDLNVSLENAKQQLSDLRQSDSATHRDLNVEQAELSLAEAQQRLAENYDALRERDIVAPFAGTIQDMQNVVVGATPTGGSEDSIDLGTLVSDEYLVTFTLDAADAAKVRIGQKVAVAVTSYPNQPQFDATITEISSLPTQSGVAQYDVSAKLDYDAKTATTILREGMLADIVIIEKEAADVLRVPTAAITYQDGKPTVQVVAELSETERQQFEAMGIVRTDSSQVPTYAAAVETGVEGRFFTEIKSGLEEGDMILTTATTQSTEAGTATVQTGFGGPGMSGNARARTTTSGQRSNGGGG